MSVLAPDVSREGVRFPLRRLRGTLAGLGRVLGDFVAADVLDD